MSDILRIPMQKYFYATPDAQAIRLRKANINELSAFIRGKIENNCLFLHATLHSSLTKEHRAMLGDWIILRKTRVLGDVGYGTSSEQVKGKKFIPSRFQATEVEIYTNEQFKLLFRESTDVSSSIP